MSVSFSELIRELLRGTFAECCRQNIRKVYSKLYSKLYSKVTVTFTVTFTVTTVDCLSVMTTSTIFDNELCRLCSLLLLSVYYLTCSVTKVFQHCHDDYFLSLRQTFVFTRFNLVDRLFLYLHYTRNYGQNQYTATSINSNTAFFLLRVDFELTRRYIGSRASFSRTRTGRRQRPLCD